MFGPFEVRVDGSRFGPRDLGGVKPKQLLEVLALERGRSVPKARIAELLWDEAPPQRVAATIQTYVSPPGGNERGARCPRSGCADQHTEAIICRTEDIWLSPENSRYLARQIERAQLVELAGVDHDPWVGDSDEALSVVERFLGTLLAAP